MVPTQRETVFVDVHHANMGQVANSHTPASVPLAPRSTQQQYPRESHYVKYIEHVGVLHVCKMFESRKETMYMYMYVYIMI